MAAPKYVFSALRGTVKTIEEKVEDGVTTTTHRMIMLLEGDPVPENVAPDELERLIKHGSVVKHGELTGTKKAMAKLEGKPTGSKSSGTSAADEAELDLTKLADYTDAELGDLWAKAKPTVTAVLEAVGTDKALAQKALAAENAATKGDGRSTLVAGLNKVIEEPAAAS